MSDTSRHFNNRKGPITVRSSLILTDTYVAGTVIDTNWEFNRVMLEIDFTKGLLTSLEVKIEVSSDGVTYRQQQGEAYSAGVTTIKNNYCQFTDTGGKTISFNTDSRYIKISFKGTGTVDNSLCAAEVYLLNR